MFIRLPKIKFNSSALLTKLSLVMPSDTDVLTCTLTRFTNAVLNFALLLFSRGFLDVMVYF